MGLWDNIKDGFVSGLMGKGPNYVKKERAKRDAQPQGRAGVSAKEVRRIAHEKNFGSGLSGGDNYWTAPVHAVLDDGRAVTVSFGTDKRSGETLIAEGHLSMEAFYARGRGHDHFGPNGELYGNRGALD